MPPGFRYRGRQYTPAAPCEADPCGAGDYGNWITHTAAWLMAVLEALPNAEAQKKFEPLLARFWEVATAAKDSPNQGAFVPELVAIASRAVEIARAHALSPTVQTQWGDTRPPLVVPGRPPEGGTWWERLQKDLSSAGGALGVVAKVLPMIMALMALSQFSNLLSALGGRRR